MIGDFIPKWQIYMLVGIVCVFFIYIVFKFIQEDRAGKEVQKKEKAKENN